MEDASRMYDWQKLRATFVQLCFMEIEWFSTQSNLSRATKITKCMLGCIYRTIHKRKMFLRIIIANDRFPVVANVINYGAKNKRGTQFSLPADCGKSNNNTNYSRPLKIWHIMVEHNIR